KEQGLTVIHHSNSKAKLKNPAGMGCYHSCGPFWLLGACPELRGTAGGGQAKSNKKNRYCDFNSCFSCLDIRTVCAAKCTLRRRDQGSTVIHHSNSKAKLKNRAGMEIPLSFS